MRFIFTFTFTLALISSFSQTYIGEVATHDGFQYIRLEIKNDSTTISFPNELRQVYRFNYAVTTDKSFKLKVRAELREFVVNAVNFDTIELATAFTGHEQIVNLKRQLPPINEQELDAFAGNFIDNKGNIALVYVRSGKLFFMSPYTEQTLSIMPIDKNLFWSSTGEIISFSKTINQKFHQISVTNRRGKSVSLKKSYDYSINEDWVLVDGDSIYVNLFMPDLESTMPACLILPGGGGQSQMSNAVYEARFFAAHGIIAMTFDKAGVGRSKGASFENYTFKEKVRRYEQLFNYLKTQKKVELTKVGLHGPSEGGRLALMMGAKMRDAIAFINATAAPIMTMEEGQLYAANHYHRNQDVSEVDITTLNSIWKTYYDGIINKKIDTSNFSLMRNLQQKYNRLFVPPLSNIIPLSPKKEDLIDGTVVTDAHKIVCPVFLQYGENDQRVNPVRSLKNFYQHASSGLDITAEIYNRGNHSMMTPEQLICPGYAYDKVKWLKQIGILK